MLRIALDGVVSKGRGIEIHDVDLGSKGAKYWITL